MLTSYRVTCCTDQGEYDSFSYSDGLFTTSKKSGILGDPHVLGSDAVTSDFFGEAGVYNLFESETMSVQGRLDLAVKGASMLFHPDVMKAGTLMQEVSVTAGDARLRLALHAGGLVSVADSHLETSFLTPAADASFALNGVQVAWTQVDEAEAFEWGTHNYSQKLQVTTSADVITMYVAESQGYRFIDVQAETTVDHANAAGLLNVALKTPAALRTQLSQHQEAAFLVGNAEASAALL